MRARPLIKGRAYKIEMKGLTSFVVIATSSWDALDIAKDLLGVV
jgi:hypothetical protein